MCVVHWRGSGSLRFEGASIGVCDAYGDTFDDIAPVAAGS